MGIRVGIAVVVLSSIAMAAFIWSPTIVSVPEVSPGATAFMHTFFINTQPAASGGAKGGFGDVILAVEEGRDDRGPFAAVIVQHGANSPHNLMLPVHQCYPGAMPPGAPAATAPDGPGGNPMGVDCSIQPLPVGIRRRYMYRPTNDPVNPGWGVNGAAAAAGQVESGVVACHAVAEAIRQYASDVRNARWSTPPPGLLGPGVIPTIMLEVDFDTSNPWTSNDLEFYKFKIQTLGNP